jgi:PE family
MSFMLAEPGALVAAASEVAGIGSTLSTAHVAAAAPTTGVLAAAADEVSTQIAALFSQHARSYQQLSARAAAFHEQFVAALAATASDYAAAETAAAKTLTNAVSAPAQALLGHPLGGALSNAVSRVEAVFAGNGMAGALSGGGSSPFHGINAGALLGRPTGGVTATTAAGPLLHAAATSAHAIPAAFGSIATSIENLYNYVEPYVQYVFNLAAYAVGWLPWVGILAPQINFIYDLFEPIVQSALFNSLDWLTGAISFSQGLSNFWATTTASINWFIQTEINWVLGFLPPLPPLPPPVFP